MGLIGIRIRVVRVIWEQLLESYYFIVTVTSGPILIKIMNIFCKGYMGNIELFFMSLKLAQLKIRIRSYGDLFLWEYQQKQVLKVISFGGD